MSSKFTDIKLGDLDIRIMPFSPSIGAMTAVQTASGTWLRDEVIFSLIRGNCLDVCSVMQEHGGVVMPVKMYAKASGTQQEKWLIPNFQLSPADEFRLLMEVTSVNLRDFFPQAVTQQDGPTATPDTNPPASPKA